MTSLYLSFTAELQLAPKVLMTDVVVGGLFQTPRRVMTWLPDHGAYTVPRRCLTSMDIWSGSGLPVDQGS